MLLSWWYYYMMIFFDDPSIKEAFRFFWDINITSEKGVKKVQLFYDYLPLLCVLIWSHSKTRPQLFFPWEKVLSNRLSCFTLQQQQRDSLLRWIYDIENVIKMAFLTCFMHTMLMNKIFKKVYKMISKWTAFHTKLMCLVGS